MSWEGRCLITSWTQVLAVAGALGLPMAAALLIHPAAILLALVTLPVALFLTLSRAAHVSLSDRRLTVRWGRHTREVDLDADGTKVTLCRWTHQIPATRGLAVRFQPRGGKTLVIGTREHSLPVQAGEVETCRRIDVVLPDARFGELLRTLADNSASDRDAIVALLTPGRSAVFDLWPSFRFPYAFLSVLIGLAGVLGFVALCFGHSGVGGVLDSPWFRNGGIALVVVGLLFDVRALSRPLRVALRLTAENGELVLRRPDKSPVLARADLGSIQATKGIWRGDIEERLWQGLPSLRISAGSSFLLTVGVMAGSSTAQLTPGDDRPWLRWPTDVRRGRAPKYLALLEDWPELVRVTTMPSLT